MIKKSFLDIFDNKCAYISFDERLKTNEFPISKDLKEAEILKKEIMSEIVYTINTWGTDEELNYKPEGTLADLHTPEFIYVDLNSILHANALVLSEWFRKLNKSAEHEYYKGVAEKLLEAIDEVLWDDEKGAWFDYDNNKGKQRTDFYPSNLTPLWTGSYNKSKSYYYAEKVIKYLKDVGIIGEDLTPKFLGIPASLQNIKEELQWDFPNCWAPHQAFVIQGLERTKHPVAQSIAYKMAQKWVKTGFYGYNKKENPGMFEKYGALRLGMTGSGGEYKPETGFGWTNGFYFELFHMWGEYFNWTEIEKLEPTLPLPI